MMTSLHVTAAEVRHQQNFSGKRKRHRVCEIIFKREKEGKKLQVTERQRKLGRFFMMRFGSAK